MSAAPTFAEAIPNLAGVAMLLLGLLLPMRRRRDAAARLVAWQGGLLGLAAATAAWGGASAAAPLLWLLAFGALAARGALLPALLRLAAGGDGPRDAVGHAIQPGDEAVPRTVEVPRAVGFGSRPNAAVPLLAGGGLAMLAVAAVIPAGAGIAAGTREGLALALAVLLAGLLAMLLRRGVAFGLLGLLAAENGALLGLVHAADAALPGPAALAAVLSPGFVACAALAARNSGGGGGAVRAVFGASRR